MSIGRFDASSGPSRKHLNLPTIQHIIESQSLPIVFPQVLSQQIMLPHANRGEFPMKSFSLFAVVVVVDWVAGSVPEEFGQVEKFA
jgi:hypothetical protein